MELAAEPLAMEAPSPPFRAPIPVRDCTTFPDDFYGRENTDKTSKNTYLFLMFTVIATSLFTDST